MAYLLALPLLALGSVASASQSQLAFQSKCAQFADKISIPNAKVNFVEFVAGGTNLSIPDYPSSCTYGSYQEVTVDLCRIAMAVTTSNSSELTFEAWFPREYKGRFSSTGNGGISGCKCQAGPLLCFF